MRMVGVRIRKRGAMKSIHPGSSRNLMPGGPVESVAIVSGTCITFPRHNTIFDCHISDRPNGACVHDRANHVLPNAVGFQEVLVSALLPSDRHAVSDNRQTGRSDSTSISSSLEPPSTRAGKRPAKKEVPCRRSQCTGPASAPVPSDGKDMKGCENAQIFSIAWRRDRLKVIHSRGQLGPRPRHASSHLPIWGPCNPSPQIFIVYIKVISPYHS